MIDKFKTFLDSMSKAEQRTLAAVIMVAMVSVGLRQYMAEEASGYRLISQYDEAAGLWKAPPDKREKGAPSLPPPVRPRESAPTPIAPSTAPNNEAPSEGETTALPSASARANGPVDINVASARELDALPNIGSVKAGSIVAYRELNGPFASVEDLVKISGIGRATLDGLRPYITCSSPGQVQPASPTQIPPSGVKAIPSIGGEVVVDINRGDVGELSQLPGIGEALARRIMDYRAANGPFARPEDLLQVRGIGPKTLEKMRPMIKMSR